MVIYSLFCNFFYMFFLFFYSKLSPLYPFWFNRWPEEEKKVSWGVEFKVVSPLYPWEHCKQEFNDLKKFMLLWNLRLFLFVFVHLEIAFLGKHPPKACTLRWSWWVWSILSQKQCREIFSRWLYIIRWNQDDVCN